MSTILMNPILKKIESFQVSGIQVRTTNAQEWDQSTAQIPSLWARFPNEVLEVLLPQPSRIAPRSLLGFTLIMNLTQMVHMIFWLG